MLTYKQYREVAALGNAAHPSADGMETAKDLFSKLISSHPKQIKQIFVNAMVRGELEDNPGFESELKDVLRHLPAIKIDKPDDSLSKLQRRKKREQDPLNNVVARSSQGADGSDGGGESGGEG